MNRPLFVPPDLGLKLDEAGLWTALISWAGEPLPLAKPNAAAVFDLAERPPPAAPGLLLETATGLQAVAVLQAFPFKAMFGSDIGPAELWDLPDALRDAILEGIVALVAGALPPSAFAGLRVAGAGAAGALADRLGGSRLRWFAVGVKGVAPEPVAVQVGVDPARLGRAVTSGPLATRTVWTGLKTRLEAEVVLSLGSLELPLAEARGLASGDIVVLPERAPDGAVLRAGEWLFELKPEGERWSVLARAAGRRYRPSPEPRSGASPMSDPSAAKGGAERLPVVLDFDLGRTTVTVAELESWQPGAVIALDLPAPGDGVEVTVRANGAVVGVGDLVRIDDRVGVRLTRLAFAQ